MQKKIEQVLRYLQVNFIKLWHYLIACKEKSPKDDLKYNYQ